MLSKKITIVLFLFLMRLPAISLASGQSFIFNAHYWREGPVEGAGSITDVLEGDVLVMSFDSKDNYRQVQERNKRIDERLVQRFSDNEKLTFQIRVFGINAAMPAMSKEQLESAEPVKVAVKGYALNKPVRFYCFLTDYYGRPSCSVLIDKTNDLGLWMIRTGYSYYDLSYGPHALNDLHELYQREDR